MKKYTEPEKFAEKVDGVFVTPEKMYSLAAGAVSLLELETGEHAYRVTLESSYRHTRGSGGWRNAIVVLEVNDTILLMSVKAWTWKTYCDDSEDQGEPPRDTTYLVTDHPFSRAVFEKICQLTQA